jgi:hypothetical protein
MFVSAAYVVRIRELISDVSKIGAVAPKKKKLFSVDILLNLMFR